MSQLPNQKVLRELLHEQLSLRQNRNPSYSIRSFSRGLKVNHSALSEIMRGKRKAGAKVAKRIAESLMLDGESKSRLFSASTSKDSISPQTSQLSADEFKAIADWYHFALLSLIDTEGFQNNLQWIAQRLGCSQSQMKAAISRLQRLGLIDEKKSKLRVTGNPLTTSDGIPDAAIRKSHYQFLAMAQDSLERDAVSNRDFATVTMAIDPQKLPEARRKIREFRDELCRFLESDAKKEVFELGIQLIPLSKEV